MTQNKLHILLTSFRCGSPKTRHNAEQCATIYRYRLCLDERTSLKSPGQASIHPYKEPRETLSPRARRRPWLDHPGLLRKKGRVGYN